jgi:hypothetical protein
MLAKSLGAKKYDLSSIRTVRLGAVLLSREISKKVKLLWPKEVINVKQGWGITK